MKIMNSKIYHLLEKTYDVLFVNLLFVISAIPIVTLMPATMAAIRLLTSKESEEGSVLVRYIKTYFYYIKKSILLSVITSLTIFFSIIFLRIAILNGHIFLLILAFIILFELVIVNVGIMVGIMNHENVSMMTRYINAIIVGHRNLISITMTLIVISIMIVICHFFLPFLFAAFSLTIIIINKLKIKWSDLDDSYYIR